MCPQNSMPFCSSFSLSLFVLFLIVLFFFFSTSSHAFVICIHTHDSYQFFSLFLCPPLAYSRTHALQRLVHSQSTHTHRYCNSSPCSDIVGPCEQTRTRTRRTTPRRLCVRPLLSHLGAIWWKMLYFQRPTARSLELLSPISPPPTSPSLQSPVVVNTKINSITSHFNTSIICQKNNEKKKKKNISNNSATIITTPIVRQHRLRRLMHSPFTCSSSIAFDLSEPWIFCKTIRHLLILPFHSFYRAYPSHTFRRPTFSSDCMRFLIYVCVCILCDKNLPTI